jgi:ribosome-associated heat shock protein Hsp15
MDNSDALNTDGIRLDRYLWHVRLSKTRTLATQACQSGDVRFGDDRVKPSKIIYPGAEFSMKRGGGNRSYRVLSLVAHRISAKEVKTYLEETTSPEVLEAIKVSRQAPGLKRDKGMGRPTKRDLRMIEKLFS